MKKIVTIVAMAMVSLPAGIIVLVGLLIIDAVRAIATRRARGPVARAKITREHRERFYGSLGELEHRVQNVGPTIIKRQEA